MVGLGSAFLGDVRRNRLVSPSSPPTSPTPASSHSRSPSMKDLFQTTSSPTSPPQHPPTPPPPQPVQPVVIDPVLSLELRLRWLEALLLGVRQEIRSGRERDRVLMPDTKAGETLTRMAEDVQKQLNVLVDSNEWLKRFMEKCSSLSAVLSSKPVWFSDFINTHFLDEQHASLLTPPFIVSGTAPNTPPSYENMTPAELEAFLAEMEPDIRAADRDMREIEVLEKKGVTAAGKLIGMHLVIRLFKPVLISRQ
jgi:hypothetical protein